MGTDRFERLMCLTETSQHRKYIRMSDVLKYESDRMNGSDV
jgi:hypothetical protein